MTSLPHVTDEVLRRFRSGELPPEELLAVDDHLSECEGCAASSQRSVRHLEVDLTDGGEVVERAAHTGWLIAAAVAVVAAVSGTLVPLMMSTSTPHRLAARQTFDPSSRRGESRAPNLQRPNTGDFSKVDYGNAAWNDLVGRALATGTLPLEPLEVRGEGDRVRGVSETAAGNILAPDGTAVVERRPLFRWTASPGTRYVVTVFRDERKVARSPLLTTTEWRSDRELAAGTTFTWQVEARTDGSQTIIPSPPALPPLFRTLTVEQRQELDDAARRFPADKLLAAVLCARAGARDCATAELKAWHVADPAAALPVAMLQHLQGAPRSTKADQ